MSCGCGGMQGYGAPSTQIGTSGWTGNNNTPVGGTAAAGSVSGVPPQGGGSAAVLPFAINGKPCTSRHGIMVLVILFILWLVLRK